VILLALFPAAAFLPQPFRLHAGLLFFAADSLRLLGDSLFPVVLGAAALLAGTCFAETFLAGDFFWEAALAGDF